MRNQYQSLVSGLISACILCTNLSLNALELAEIEAVEAQVKDLAESADKGLSQVPSLVTQLNQFETQYNALTTTPNNTHAPLEEAVLRTKFLLANHVYEYALYPSLQADMIALATGTSHVALAQKSINLAIMLGGPTTRAEQFYTSYLSDLDLGGLRFRETLMYFTFHPKQEIKSDIDFFASELAHPIFRGPASWIYGKLSTPGDSVAIAKLAKALNQSIADNYGFDTTLLTLLGLAEVADFKYITANYGSAGLPPEYLTLIERYITYRKALLPEKLNLIKANFKRVMSQYERDEALKLLLTENRSSILANLNLMHDVESGLFIAPELADLANILGYTISGSADNPVITAKSLN